MTAAWAVDLRDVLHRQRARIAIACVLLVVVYFLVAFGEQAWRARQLQAQAAQQRAAIAALQHENDELQDQLDGYATDAYYDYVQQRARRDLSLAHPGETVLLVRWSGPVATNSTVQQDSEAAEQQPKWRRWMDVFSAD